MKDEEEKKVYFEKNENQNYAEKQFIIDGREKEKQTVYTVTHKGKMMLTNREVMWQNHRLELM